MSMARIFFGMDEVVPPEVPQYVEDFDLADAPGFYHTTPHEVMGFNVFNEEGSLYLKDPYGRVPLHHKGGNRFQVGKTASFLFLGSQPAVLQGQNLLPLLKPCVEAQDSACLLPYEGTYFNDEIATEYTVYEEDGKLYMDHFRNFTAQLIPYKRDYFIYAGSPSVGVEFMRGSGGTVLGFKVHTGRVQGLGFTKRQL